MIPMPQRTHQELTMAETATFVPTAEELDLLLRLDAGEAMPFPDDLKVNSSERLYENGFVTVGVDGGLHLSDRGREVAHGHQSATA
jgi:hypothetical protein